MFLCRVIRSYKRIILTLLFTRKNNDYASTWKHNNYASLHNHNYYASVWKHINYASIILLGETILSSWFRMQCYSMITIMLLIQYLLNKQINFYIQKLYPSNPHVRFWFIITILSCLGIFTNFLLLYIVIFFSYCRLSWSYTTLSFFHDNQS